MTANQPTRTARKKEDTQNKIIAAAVNLFNQHGIAAVTMEQIAAAADVAKGTLYNYFPFKEAILNAYIQRSFQTSNTERLAQFASLSDTRSRLTYLFTALLAGVQRQKDIFEAFMIYRMKQVTSFHPLPPEEQTGLALLIRTILITGQQANELRRDLPLDLLEGLFEYTLIAAIKPLYLDPAHYNQEQAIAQAVDLFLSGAKA